MLTCLNSISFYVEDVAFIKGGYGKIPHCIDIMQSNIFYFGYLVLFSVVYIINVHIFSS